MDTKQDQLPDRYDGGIDLRREDGVLSASVELYSRFGRIHMTQCAIAQRGSATTTVDLTADEAVELAGALVAAAAAANHAKAKEAAA